MSDGPPHEPVDERLIEEIVDRVTANLRRELETIAAQLATSATAQPLTVEQLARRFGLARSTVYAHWREWGGYKLGDGPKAPIRFPPQALPASSARQAQEKHQVTPSRRAQTDGRRLLRGAPRLPATPGDPLQQYQPLTPSTMIHHP